jgi:hypothetical protein
MLVYFYGEANDSLTTKQLSRVLWSDESKYNLFGSNGIWYERRSDGERIDIRQFLPTVKYGDGDIKVCG